MKKNKTQTDPFATSGWHHNSITDPCQVFAECFSVTSLAALRTSIRGLLLATRRNKVYRRESPADVLLCIKLLQSLLHAAHRLKQDKKTSPVQVNDHNMLERKFFCGTHIHSADWDFLPRSLTAKEYKDPYKVFKKLFHYQSLPQWVDALQDIQDFALSGSCEDADLPLMKLYLHLTKMVEAAHLIDVREITHIGGFLKNRVK